MTLDGYCAFDVRREPLVVHVPAPTEPRWYLVQIGDFFDEIIHNVGGIKGPTAWRVRHHRPGFRGILPGEMTEVRSCTTQRVLGARVFVNGEADLEAAATAQ